MTRYALLSRPRHELVNSIIDSLTVTNARHMSQAAGNLHSISNQSTLARYVSSSLCTIVMQN